MFHKLVQKLRTRGVVPAALVAFAVTAAVAAPNVGAGSHSFLSTVYCSAAGISANPPSGQPAGTQVVFTATSTCLNSGQMYEFWLRAASQSSWQLIQSFSTSATYNWNSTGAAQGIVYFGVWVKDAQSTTSTFDNNASMPFTVSSPCTAAGITANPTSVAAGVHSTLTGTSTCAPNTGQLYEFWLRSSTSAWILAQAFSTSATYDWNSTGAPVGTIYFGLWVKSSTSTTATFDNNASTTVTVTSPCSAAGITALPTSVAPGVHSVLTATSTCTPNTGQMYEFWLRSSTSAWILAQAFSTSASYDWNSTGAPVGTIYFGVWVKSSTSTTATFDANASTTVTVTSPCTAAGLTALPTTVTGGVHSVLTATSTCTPNTGQMYEFWLRTSTSAWILAQAFSTSATYDWNSAGAPAGTIYFGVWVKSSTSTTTTFDANASTTVAVT